MRQRLALAVRDVVGDARLSMLRHRDIAEEGLRRYGGMFAARSGAARRLLLLDTPEHDNLGDHAIAMAERRMLRSVGDPVIECPGDVRRYLMCMQRYTTGDDVICIQGGGNMGVLYEGPERSRNIVIDMMRRNTIVVFPQTLDYDDSPEARRLLAHTQRVYARHPDLYLVARERRSYERMRRLYPHNHVLLTPDIVLSLDETRSTPFARRDGLLMCMRADKERRMDDGLCAFVGRLALDRGLSVSRTDTVARGERRLSAARGEQLVEAKWDEFRHARLVVTDRLHGMVFSAITGTPCLAFDNANGKVGNEYQWLRRLPYIRFAHPDDDIAGMIDGLLALNGTHWPADVFAPLYAPLREVLARGRR